MVKKINQRKCQHKLNQLLLLMVSTLAIHIFAVCLLQPSRHVRLLLFLENLVNGASTFLSKIKKISGYFYEFHLIFKVKFYLENGRKKDKRVKQEKIMHFKFLKNVNITKKPKLKQLNKFMLYFQRNSYVLGVKNIQANVL